MNFIVNSNQSLKTNLELNENVLVEIENFLIHNNFHEQEKFIKWQEDFKFIYGTRHIDLKLYLILSLIYFTGHFLILKCVSCINRPDFSDNNYPKLFHNIRTQVWKKFRNYSIFDFDYFYPIQEFFNLKKFCPYLNLLDDIKDFVFNLDLNPEYIFDYFVHLMIPQDVRHTTGEYYTPYFIVKKMIKESYNFGEKVIDPCCGSGNFLIEILKKILLSKNSEENKIFSINNLFGYDINPISIFMTKINFLLLTNKFPTKLEINLYVFDSLFIQQDNQIKKELYKNLKNTFDLVIGNPPWYTFRDIESVDYQNKIKNLAENLGIKPLPKNILNIEISALFFYHAKEIFLKQNGKVFFVITKGVITGSHASRFRNFQGFKNTKIWFFDKKLNNIFNIDFICLFARKSENELDLANEKIKVFYLRLNNKNSHLGYFDDLKMVIEKEDIFLPYFIEKKGKKVFTKKFISKNTHKELIPYGESYYKKKFHKGADLNPRNLIFVKYNKINDTFIKINPEEKIFKRAKAPWNKKEFYNEIIEYKYLFNVIKSTELVKFNVYDSYHVFLPLSKRNLKFNYDQLTDNAKRFYNKINQIYLKYKKATTKHKSLMENLNRWDKLINLRQLSKIKVIYNNSGAILNSAVIRGNYLITGDLSFYDTENLEEAFYLSSILNSNLMSKQVKIRKSSRHIFKIPFEVPIKKFNPYNKNHIKLANLGKKCHDIALNSIKKIMPKDNYNLSKIKLQKKLAICLYSSLEKIDEILEFELY